MTQTPSIVPGPGDRVYLGAELRAAREYVGMSAQAAAAVVDKTQSALSKYERGVLLPSPEDVDALCRLYQLPTAKRDELVTLAAALKGASRMVLAQSGAASIQRRIAELEASSTLIRAFQPMLVLGLLQTERYIQYVMAAEAWLDPDNLAEASQQRIARQRKLADPTKQFVLLMTEGSLRWHVGSPDLMAGQVDAIADIDATRPNVRIGLIPWTTPVTMFPLHGFHLYDHDAVLVATESATGVLEKPTELAMYEGIFTDLEQAASFGEELHMHLTRIADDYRSRALPDTETR